MNLPPPFVPEKSILCGVGASSGIAIGPARVHTRRDLTIPNYRVKPGEADAEVERFSSARDRVRENFIHSRDSLPTELLAQAGILDAHLMLLDDPALAGKTTGYIKRDFLNAEQAVLATIKEVSVILEKVEDPYIRSRLSDVEMVGYSVLGALRGAVASDMPDAPEGSILIVEDISPAEMSRLATSRVAGLATESGSHTSHTAIVAQAIELPAVLGVGAGLLTGGGINNGDTVIVDGRTGHLIVRPDADTISFYRSRQKMEQSFKAEIVRCAHMPALTLDDRRVTVMGNMELMEELPAILSYGAEGIGLYRTEFMYMNRDTLPTEDELFSVYKKVVESTAPNPVVIRTFDLGGDKMPSARERGGRRAKAKIAHREGNQALGLRGIRYSLRNLSLFKAQLRAILRASAYGDARVMFPMISSLDEVKTAKAMLSEAQKALAAEGIPQAGRIPVGIMLEVPATIFIARELAAEADFFSIGTNDLIQYTLAVDRGNPEVRDMYQPLHPAILRMIRTILNIAREENVPVSICGDMAASYVTAPLLVGLGAETLSMPSAAIPRIKRILRMSSSAELEAWAKEAMGAHSAPQATSLATRYLCGKFPELFQ